MDAARHGASSELAAKLTQASRRKAWDVHRAFAWPQRLDGDRWWMPPELISLYGTDLWQALDEPQRRALSRYELGNFFSLVLHGERPLVQGLAHRLYLRRTPHAISEYLHHFIDEENKHMAMFGQFCTRYVGRIYPEKKLALQRTWAAGEEEVAFFCKVMVIEEIGDHYNVAIARDERCQPLVRELNRVHHVDEARHLAFGRRYTAELFALHARDWPAPTLDAFRSWLADYLRASWGDYYNPAVYRDAGLPHALAARETALSHPACRQHRLRASHKLVAYFLEHGLLGREPEL